MEEQVQNNEDINDVENYHFFLTGVCMVLGGIVVYFVAAGILYMFSVSVGLVLVSYFIILFGILFMLGSIIGTIIGIFRGITRKVFGSS